MIKLIGFDLDDTLWDLKPVLIRAERILGQWLADTVTDYKHDRETLDRLRKNLAREKPELLTQLTAFRFNIIQSALILHGLAATEATKTADKAMAVFLEARNQIDLFDGAGEVLESLAQQYNLCALSNGNADIYRLGLGETFDFAYSAEAVGAAKPAPDLFHAALNQAGLRPEEMIYVGDDPDLDVDAAAKLGIHTVWFDHGKKTVARYKPNAIITDIRQLPDAITKLAETILKSKP